MVCSNLAVCWPHYFRVCLWASARMFVFAFICMLYSKGSLSTSRCHPSIIHFWVSILLSLCSFSVRSSWSCLTGLIWECPILSVPYVTGGVQRCDMMKGARWWIPFGGDPCWIAKSSGPLCTPLFLWSTTAKRSYFNRFKLRQYTWQRDPNNRILPLWAATLIKTEIFWCTKYQFKSGE